MRLIPRQQWLCDTCGEVIEKPEDGWLEWLHADGIEGRIKHGFKIVHHASTSPKNPNRPSRRPAGNLGCYNYDGVTGEETCHLDRVIGPDGLPFILAMLDKGPYIDPERKVGVRSVPEWTELIRRLALPYYEEARLYLDRAYQDGFVSGMNEFAIYSPDVLKEVIENYAPPDGLKRR